MRWARTAGQPFVIAEIGASHGGSFDECERLIGAAEVAGCQAIKIQYYDPIRLAVRRNANPEWYTRYAVPRGWLPRLAGLLRANERAKTLVISVYDQQGLYEAIEYADILKIASFEASDYSLLRISSQGKPVIVSTGLQDHGAMTRLCAWRDKGRNERALLHCMSVYPCPVSEARLRLITAYDLDGYSDHTGRWTSGGLAVACGARILELHVRSVKTPKTNPDYAHSLTETDLVKAVQFAREAAVACLAPLHRKVETVEEPMRRYAVREAATT